MLEALPPETARNILLRLHPVCVENLLATNRRIRSLNWYCEDDFAVARKHIEFHVPKFYEDYLHSSLCAKIPFMCLPMAFALGLISSQGPVDDVFHLIFPEDFERTDYEYETFEPVQHAAKIERLFRKALDLNLITLTDWRHRDALLGLIRLNLWRG
ncbi:hypothetical protein HDU96_006640 [Phlyctochytrium bullatum]|nr:hypothetical protein HDU96_006640 [Phlyctochytrium bullatum]